MGMRYECMVNGILRLLMTYMLSINLNRRGAWDDDIMDSYMGALYSA